MSTKFTVVVPTRERCDTLRSTLRTCVDQNYDRLEILVSDNLSRDATRDVVSSYTDPRLRYINTGRRLSMSHNWEFALSHVTDGYVMFLGDDDGLLPNALSDLDGLLRETEAKAVNWRTGTYGWPGSAFPWIRNKLKVPIGQGQEWRDAKEVLGKVLSFRWGYHELPMLYGFFVHRDAITAATQPGKPFFRSMTPDIYSGIAVSTVIDRFLHSRRPYSIYGMSQHSTGASFFNASVDRGSAAKFVEEPNIPFHKKLALTSSMPVVTAECYFQALDAGLDPSPVQLSVEQVVEAALLETNKLRSPVRETVLDALLSICERNDLGEVLRRRVKDQRPTVWGKVIPQVSIAPAFQKVVFDGQKEGIQDIASACDFAGRVLERSRRGEHFFRERTEFVRSHVSRIADAVLKRNREKWGY